MINSCLDGMYGRFGMVFYFWGSTVLSVKHAGDANGNSKNRRGFPFLFEGQHRYRFAWHLIGSKAKVYKALRPASKGILTYRMKDQNKDGIINNQEVLNRGLDPSSIPRRGPYYLKASWAFVSFYGSTVKSVVV